jgi:hypothetical protein
MIADPIAVAGITRLSSVRGGLGSSHATKRSISSKRSHVIVGTSSQPDQVEPDTDEGRASDVVGPSAELLTG